jgi:hypothetical protein
VDPGDVIAVLPRAVLVGGEADAAADVVLASLDPLSLSLHAPPRMLTSTAIGNGTTSLTARASATIAQGYRSLNIHISEFIHRPTGLSGAARLFMSAAVHTLW